MAVMGRVTPGCHPRARCLLLTAIPEHAGNDMLLVMLAAVDAAVTTAWGAGGAEPPRLNTPSRVGGCCGRMLTMTFYS